MLDPEQDFGRRIDAETGVPTRALYDACTAGGGQDMPTVAEWFDVPLEAVCSAARFEQWLRDFFGQKSMLISTRRTCVVPSIARGGASCPDHSGPSN